MWRAHRLTSKIISEMTREGERGYQRCVSCIMDTTDPGISFDADGRCSHCRRVLEAGYGYDPKRHPERLDRLIQRIKVDGRNQDYDVVAGLSGGVDSSYLILKAKEWGLRVLVVHVDTGWNSELAVSNIENLVRHCGFDLLTHVVDWQEMQDLQYAFFKSGVPNQDIPQDHAIFAAFIRSVADQRVRWNFSGSNTACEAILPPAWGYCNRDWRHIRDIHRRFGRRQLRAFPHISHLEHGLRYELFHGLKTARPLNLIDYKKNAAIAELESKAGWRYYGGKHYESRFTKFFQAWYLPTKWGYDKRLAHLSSLIVSGQLTRDEALQESRSGGLQADAVESEKDYMARKLGILRSEFDELMLVPNTPHEAYRQSPPILTVHLPALRRRVLSLLGG